MVSPPTHHCVPCGTPPTQPNMLDSLFCIYSIFFNIQQCLGEARGSRAFFFCAKTAARAVKTASLSKIERFPPYRKSGALFRTRDRALFPNARLALFPNARRSEARALLSSARQPEARALLSNARQRAQKKSPACAGDLSFACENYFLRFSSKAFSMSASSLGSVPSLSNLE